MVNTEHNGIYAAILRRINTNFSHKIILSREKLLSISQWLLDCHRQMQNVVEKLLCPVMSLQLYSAFLKLINLHHFFFSYYFNILVLALFGDSRTSTNFQSKLNYNMLMNSFSQAAVLWLHRLFLSLVYLPLIYLKRHNLWLHFQHPLVNSTTWSFQQHSRTSGNK